MADNYSGLEPVNEANAGIEELEKGLQKLIADIKAARADLAKDEDAANELSYKKKLEINTKLHQKQLDYIKQANQYELDALTAFNERKFELTEEYQKTNKKRLEAEYQEELTRIYKQSAVARDNFEYQQKLKSLRLFEQANQTVQERMFKLNLKYTEKQYKDAVQKEQEKIKEVEAAKQASEAREDRAKNFSSYFKRFSTKASQVNPWLQLKKNRSETTTDTIAASSASNIENIKTDQIKTTLESDDLTGDAVSDETKVLNQIAKTMVVVQKNTSEINNTTADQAKSNKKNRKEKQKLGEKEQAIFQGISDATAYLSTVLKQLRNTIDEISAAQAPINARLHGATYSASNGLYYNAGDKITWENLNDSVSQFILSTEINTQDYANNIKNVVNSGIARDIEAIAMIETIKDRIAPTFNALDGTLKRMVKIQNENNTFDYLGIEATLNEILNNSFKNTEYLSTISSSVRSSLSEAEYLMSGNSAVAFDFAVQKWLGSLSSVGVSDNAVTSIASTIGQIASGQIEGVTNGGTGNLLVMAANRAGLSISDILASSLDSSETNELLNQMVEYMKELVTQANGNLVVQQQLAKVFGLSASDLKAAVGLSTSYKAQNVIYNTLRTNDDLALAATDIENLSVGQMIKNLKNNISYSTASQIATSTVSQYALMVSDILESVAGGLSFSLPTIFGTGLTTQWNVSDLINTGVLATGLIKALGAGFNNGAFSSTLSNKQGLINIASMNTAKIQSGSAIAESGSTGLTVNSSLEDLEATYTAEKDSSSKKTVKNAKTNAEQSEDEVTNKVIDQHIVAIYNLLKLWDSTESNLHINTTEDKPIFVRVAGSYSSSGFLNTTSSYSSSMGSTFGSGW